MQNILEYGVKDEKPTFRGMEPPAVVVSNESYS
jgi:hypothetical protein